MPPYDTLLQACNRQTVYCVPLYDTLGNDTVQYILDHSGGCRQLAVLVRWKLKVDGVRVWPSAQWTKGRAHSR